MPKVTLGIGYTGKSNHDVTGWRLSPIRQNGIGTMQLKRDTSEIPPPGTAWFGNEGSVSAAMYDPVEQERGWLTAFDADSGGVRWKYQASRPILAGVTPTAGGVVFAADMGGRAYAFDAATGKVLWQIDTGQSTGGGIVTYQASGRQLVGIASGMKSPIWPDGAAASRIVVYGHLVDSRRSWPAEGSRWRAGGNPGAHAELLRQQINRQWLTQVFDQPGRELRNGILDEL